MYSLNRRAMPALLMVPSDGGKWLSSCVHKKWIHLRFLQKPEIKAQQNSSQCTQHSVWSVAVCDLKACGTFASSVLCNQHAATLTFWIYDFFFRISFLCNQPPWAGLAFSRFPFGECFDMFRFCSKFKMLISTSGSINLFVYFTAESAREFQWLQTEKEGFGKKGSGEFLFFCLFFVFH